MFLLVRVLVLVMLVFYIKSINAQLAELQTLLKRIEVLQYGVVETSTWVQEDVDYVSSIGVVNVGKPIQRTSSQDLRLHYIVIYGYDNDGFMVNDPNFVARSGRRWTFSEIQYQIKNIWAYSKESSRNAGLLADFLNWQTCYHFSFYPGDDTICIIDFGGSHAFYILDTP